MSVTTTSDAVDTRGSGAARASELFARRRRPIVGALAVLVALLAVLTSAGTDLFYGHMIVITLVYAALATAWNVVGGFAGQLSLGHAGFFGIGAYTSSVLYVDHGISPWIGMLLALVLGGLVALAVGIPTFRLRGPYFALATLALGTILLDLSINFRSLTRGEGGLSIPFEPSWANMTFYAQWPYAIIASAYLLICLAVSARIAGSRLGYQLAAVREDEEASRALGVDTTRVKLIAGTVSGALAAGAGVIYAQYVLFINPDSVLGVAVSVQIIVLAVVGGTGVVLGPVLGAVVLVPVSELLLKHFGGALPGLQTLVYGVVVIVVILFSPRGLHGLLRAAVTRAGRGRQR